MRWGDAVLPPAGSRTGLDNGRIQDSFFYVQDVTVATGDTLFPMASTPQTHGLPTNADTSNFQVATSFWFIYILEVGFP
jgi:hypothetical protein